HHFWSLPVGSSHPNLGAFGGRHFRMVDFAQRENGPTFRARPGSDFVSGVARSPFHGVQKSHRFELGLSVG
ncbi:hypothetical protein EBU71_21390, partial [bacterium]|nr:hypothetical protein [Candidatus Elulimicrobium humile]